MMNAASFIDTNVWLYRLFDDQRIELTEREKSAILLFKLRQISYLSLTSFLRRYMLRVR